MAPHVCDERTRLVGYPSIKMAFVVNYIRRFVPALLQISVSVWYQKFLNERPDLHKGSGEPDERYEGMPDNFDRSLLPIQEEILSNGTRRVYMPRDAMNGKTRKNLIYAADPEGTFDDLVRMSGLNPDDAEVIAKLRKANGKPSPTHAPYFGKTLFLKDWDNARIRAAAEAIQRNGDQAPGKFEGAYSYTGEFDGVRVKVFTMNGEITTAFPTWKQVSG